MPVFAQEQGVQEWTDSEEVILEEAASDEADFVEEVLEEAASEENKTDNETT